MDKSDSANVAIAAYDIKQSLIRNRKECTDKIVANKLGISVAYSNRLLRVMEVIGKEALKYWVDNSAPFIYVEDACKEPKSKQVAVLKQLIAKAQTKPKGRGSWKIAASIEAHNFGAAIRRLEALKAIDIKNIEIITNLPLSKLASQLVKNTRVNEMTEGIIECKEAFAKGYESGEYI